MYPSLIHLNIKTHEAMKKLNKKMHRPSFPISRYMLSFFFWGYTSKNFFNLCSLSCVSFVCVLKFEYVKIIYGNCFFREQQNKRGKKNSIYGFFSSFMHAMVQLFIVENSSEFNYSWWKLMREPYEKRKRNFFIKEL